LKKEANEEVQDLILRKLLHPRETKSSCNESTNQTQLQRILAAVDMNAIAELDGLSVRDVPGGTISFLFQKSSFTPETVREDGLEDTDCHVK